MTAFLDGSPISRRLEALRAAGATNPEAAVLDVPCSPAGYILDRLVAQGFVAEVQERVGRFINVRYWVTPAGLAKLEQAAQSAVDPAWQAYQAAYLRPEAPSHAQAYREVSRIAEARGWTLSSARHYKRRMAKEAQALPRAVATHGAAYDAAADAAEQIP